MDTDRLLGGLTPAQQTAVVTQGEPLCILAGAGAGKTRALTRRIAYRVAAGTADADHVLALTFTRKAARELTQRLASLGLRERVAAGTFHAVAYAQLRRWWADRGRPAPVLLDRKARLLAALAAGRPGFEGVSIADLASEIEWAKARLVSPSAYEETAAATGRRPPVAAHAMAALFERYEAEKLRRGLADFDDLLGRCASCIATDPAFAAAQRWRWRHIFVDEFQDANPLQYQLLLAWLGPRLDLCVVGDPNQAIYGWNGADPGLLTGLAERWPGAQVVRLDANHRGTPQVVEAASRALGLPPGSVTSTRQDGQPVAVRAYSDDSAEVHGVVAELRRARAGGLAWSHLAVLVRTNAQAAVFEAACRAAGVPCQVAGATSLLDQPAVRAALAEIGRRPGASLATVVADLEELSGGALLAPGSGSRSAGSVTSSALGDDFVSVGGTGGGRPRSLDGEASLLALVDLARDCQRLDAAGSAAGFLAWLAATAAPGSAEPSTAAWGAEPNDSVTVCTFHRAKGLEWPAVWVTGLERGLVPMSYATTAAALAEERRLLYVALTRAEHQLRCSWAEQRRFGGRLVPREPSPWLAAISAGCDAQSCHESEPVAAGGPTWRQRLSTERQRLAGGKGGQRSHGASQSAGDPAVLDALIAWRAASARAAGVPPYVLFHDVTLAGVAAARPSTTEELLAVPGLGPVKATRYGATLLALVAQHRASA